MNTGTMTQTEFAEGLWDKLEAECPVCKTHQPLYTGHVTTHTSGPSCAVCHTHYRWEDGRPMLLFPSNIGRVFQRMKDVYKERLKEDQQATRNQENLKALSL